MRIPWDDVAGRLMIPCKNWHDSKEQGCRNRELVAQLVTTQRIQNYWVFGLLPSSGILNTRKHNVLETGAVSILRWRDTYSVGSLRKS
jgi:hypothetical protein